MKILVSIKNITFTKYLFVRKQKSKIFAFTSKPKKVGIFFGDRALKICFINVTEVMSRYKTKT